MSSRSLSMLAAASPRPVRWAASGIAFVLLILGALVDSAHADSLLNGGFESPTAPPGGYTHFVGGQSLAGWTVVGAGVLLVQTEYAEPENGISSFAAHAGLNSLDLTGAGNEGPTSGVVQTVSTSAGQAYRLSFFVGRASSASPLYSTPATVELSIDGGPRVGYTNAASTLGTNHWTQFTASFVASGTSTTIAFYNGTPAATTEAGLDSVVLTPAFDAGIGPIVGLAFDHQTGNVWVCGDFDPDLRQYTPAGSFVSSVPRPGESADDFDLEIAPEALVLNGTLVPEGTLLVINGESGVAEIYAVDKGTGAVLASLSTAFGVSHVVGGAYHPVRDTFFLVQDRVPSGTANDNLVAEIDPLTGAVLATFQTDTSLPGFTINYGDIEVSTATGNLLAVSSDESAIAHFTPAGAFVQLDALPAGLSGLSGIGLDDAGGRAWVSTPSGEVHSLDNLLWSNLGESLAGLLGHPALLGSGALTAGSPTTLSVVDARPLSSSWLVIGLTQLGLPFKGGILVPDADLVLGGIPIDGVGAVTLGFAWPAGVPSGVATYYQVWIADAVGPVGLSSTNGLRAVTP